MKNTLVKQLYLANRWEMPQPPPLPSKAICHLQQQNKTFVVGTTWLQSSTKCVMSPASSAEKHFTRKETKKWNQAKKTNKQTWKPTNALHVLFYQLAVNHFRTYSVKQSPPEIFTCIVIPLTGSRIWTSSRSPIFILSIIELSHIFFAIFSLFPSNLISGQHFDLHPHQHLEFLLHYSSSLSVNSHHCSNFHSLRHGISNDPWPTSLFL